VWSLYLNILVYFPWHLASDIHIWHLISDTWHLTCYHLTPDTWHLILTRILDMLSLDTWYLTPDTWYLTPSNWHAITWYWIFDKHTWYMILATWYWYTWHDVVTPDWILSHLTLVLHCLFMIITFTGTWHDYYTATRHLVFLYSCTLELLYSWTHISPVLMSPALLPLLIARSYWRPVECAAWCRDDEDVSHDHASVRRILNGIKFHTKKSATPHTWWGPPLESVGATSRIHSPHRAMCHMEQSATPYTWWGPPFESVGLSSESIL